METRFVEILCQKLRQQRLSRRYVARVAAEFRDHLMVLKQQYVDRGQSEEEAEYHAEEQLGDPALVAEEIVRRGIGASFIGRHALFVFVVLPVPLVLAVVLVCALLGRGFYLLAVQGLGADPMNPAVRFVVHHSFYGFAYTITPLAALCFCQIGARHRCGPVLPLISCLLLSAAGGWLKLDLVQCLASGSVKYFQRYGLDPLRASLPMIVFVIHSVIWAATRHWLPALRR